MAALTVGKAIYTQVLNEEGIIIDDIIVFRISDNKSWITTLYVNQMKDIFKQVSVDFDVEYKDVTAEYIMYVVQGPNSRKVMNKLSISPLKIWNGSQLLITKWMTL